jgi:eukaryotic-like serine/threonine-protein kinase
MLPEEHAALVAELFKSATELPTKERKAFVEEHCRSNAQLGGEVASLLQTYERADEFMERPPIDLVAEKFSRGAFASGELIGEYEIVSLIGKGGMGEVYLARDRQLHRRVALKLVRRGMDTEHVVRRFHQEQQLLANLNHPNIAQLYGAGLIADGIPFFAMEYIDGTRIDDFSREKNLSIQQRLELFTKVCAAVHYAHQHLVVHRDIKPSNILVTGDGEPKLLDFGIAKLLDAVTNAAPEQTLTLHNVLTPEYASPEHVRGDPITTASDVYSLGVLLYELLARTKPYKIDSRTPMEIARVITEKEPTKPSAALRESRFENRDSADSRFTIHDSRALRGDLDNIVLMAMRKEPQRRYSSVAQFAGDIRRHLEGLPVRARKDTFAYRSSKFLRRHRVGVAAAVVVLGAIVTGLVISIRETQVARAEKNKAEAVSNFLQEMLSTASPGATIRGGRDTLTVKEVLDKASNDLASDKLSAQPELKAQLLRVIGACYFDLGQYDLATENLQAAAQLQTRLYGEDALETLKTMSLIASVWLDKGETTKGDEFYARAVPILRQQYRHGRVSVDYLMNSLYGYGLARRLLSDPGQGEKLFREALALSAQAPPSARALIDEIETMLTLALCDQGKFSEAEKVVRAQLGLFQHREDGASKPAIAFALDMLGTTLMEQDSLTEAEQDFRQAETIYRKVHDPFYMPLGNTLRLLADALYREGKYTEAEAKIDETLKIYRTSSGPGYTNYPTALTIQGLIRSKLGHVTEAEKLLREAVQLRAQLPDSHFMKALAVGGLGEFLTAQNRFGDAEPLLLNSYDSLQRSQVQHSPRVHLALQRLVTLYEKSNKPVLAAKYRGAL